MIMTHPGLPRGWAMAVLLAMLVVTLRALFAGAPRVRPGRAWRFSDVPLLGALVRFLTHRSSVLVALRLLFAGLFVIVIVAGLFGTPIPERNFATVVTWNLWWAGLVFAIFFVGTAWCAVCPWDSLAQWLVRRRLLRRAEPNNSLNLKVPRRLRNVWPALLLFIALTWLELGAGLTTNPRGTALVALLMVVLATVSLALFRRKAFCRYFCPVGRTVGAYAKLAAVELRPADSAVCASCTTLECYHGTTTVEPCPTNLVMGRLRENSFCTSCGNCVRSCPHDNVTWQARHPVTEVAAGPAPHWDEAWFLVGLLALTAFHGLTMMPFWESWIRGLARFLGDSGQLLLSFSVVLALCLLAVAGLFATAVALTHRFTQGRRAFRRSFSSLALVALPLAFSYHLAHNLNHLVREGQGLSAVLANPLGVGTLPLSMAERHHRHMTLWFSPELLYTLQAGLLVFGFSLAIRVVRARCQTLGSGGPGMTVWQLLPMVAFVAGMTLLHLWLLMQPMIMRM